MADGNEHIRELVRKRIADIEDETRRLEKALSSLGRGGSTSARPAARLARAQAKRRPSAKRVPRGQRPKQLLAAVEANPKASIEEIAKAMGVSLTQARAVGRRLQAQGAIKPSGKGFRVVGK